MVTIETKKNIEKKIYKKPTVNIFKTNPHKMGSCCFVNTYKTQ